MDTDYYSVKWSTNAALTRTKLPQVVSFVPLLGYAVLWGDQFQQYIMRFEVLGPRHLFSPMARVELLYFGGCSVLAGLLVFYAFCPTAIRLHKTRMEYIRNVLDTADDKELERMHRALSKLLKDQPKKENERYYDEFPPTLLQLAVESSKTPELRSDILIDARARPTAVPGLSAHFEILDRSSWLANLVCSVLMLVGALIVDLH